jgi:hypothetical protein
VPAGTVVGMGALTKLSWTDEDFETIGPDFVVGAADQDRWPGIPADPEAEERIARDALAGIRAARRAQELRHRPDG